MNSPGFKIGALLSLAAHLAVLQAAVIFASDPGDLAERSEVMVVELSLAAPTNAADANVAPIANPVSANPSPAPLPSTPVVPPKLAVAKARPPKVSPKRPAQASEPKPSVELPSRSDENTSSEYSDGAVAQPSSNATPLRDTTRAGVEGVGIIRAGYGAQLASWLNRFKQYPILARRRGIEGEARVRLVMLRSGELVSSSLHQPSGSSLLDESALAMVKAASPFPRVPDELLGEHFEFEVPIAFRLH